MIIFFINLLVYCVYMKLSLFIFVDMASDVAIQHTSEHDQTNNIATL